MSLKISVVTKPKKDIPFVFFLLEKGTVTHDPIFAFLGRAEKNYLQKIAVESRVKEKEAKVFVMPGTRREVIVVGLGEKAALNPQKIGLFLRLAVHTARREKCAGCAWSAMPMKTSDETRDSYEVAATNAVMANFEFVKYKTTPTGEIPFLKEMEAVVTKPYATFGPDIKEGVRRGVIIGEEVNRCRELSNTPGGDMTPDALAAHAKNAAQGFGIRVEILNEAKMKSLGMGGVLGVGKGSDSPPRFIIMEYMHGPADKKPTVLVGKGVTFDSGGLNLKPESGIYEMHMDMSGGAAVIHALIAAARLKLKKNIVVLVPAAENMLSGRSYRPGDLLRTMGGKTIEVLNTDAEGRVIMADALEYAKRYKPALVVDVATLTGAAVVALGMRYSGLFTPEKSLREKFIALGEATGDLVWPLPLTAEYEDDIKGTFGDWANTGKNRWGGATTAAVFLWQFVKGDRAWNTTGKKEKAGPANRTRDAYPWVHLDVAPRMTSIEGDYLAKGAAGAPVRLLMKLLEEE